MQVMDRGRVPWEGGREGGREALWERKGGVAVRNMASGIVHHSADAANCLGPHFLYHAIAKVRCTLQY